jgi:sulfur-carrier protein adenylyltransferase/sulfurtransferase
MMTQKQSERYSRHLRLRDFGEEAQRRLLQAKVLVIGAGGLGSPVMQYLTAAGVGEIGLMDDDVVSLSNLHRQVLYSTADIGQLKIEVAAERLRNMNEDVRITCIPERFSAANAIQFIPDYDVIIDTTDNIPARYHINDACVRYHKPLVYGAIFRWEGQVTVFNYQEGPTYRCLFPEPPGAMVQSCDEEGVVGALPGLIGTYQALEAIKIITGKGQVLNGRMLCINVDTNSQYFFNFKRREEAVKAAYEVSDVTEIDIHTFKTLLSDENIQFLDVRTQAEFDAQNAGGMNIPLDALPKYFNKIKTHPSLLIACQSGVRSVEAIRILRSKGYQGKYYHLTRGLKQLFDMR